MNAERYCIMCSVPRKAEYAMRDLNAPDGAFFACSKHAHHVDEQEPNLAHGSIRRLMGAS